MIAVRKSLRWVSLGVVGIALVAGPRAIAGSSSDEDRIDARMTKDADDHLKSNLSDLTKREALKKEFVRAAAMHDMADTLSHDAQFAKAYATMITSDAKRHDDVVPSKKDVLQEKESIINDPEAMRLVMAQAMLMLEHDSGHK